MNKEEIFWKTICGTCTEDVIYVLVKFGDRKIKDELFSAIKF